MINELFGGIRGVYEMDIVEDGIIKDRLVKDNLIVNKAKYNMAHMLGGDQTDARYISKVALGIGTTPPALADTTLETEIVVVDVSGYEYPTNLSVLFTANLGTNEGNIGAPYTESALKYKNGDLCARVVYTARPKTSHISFIIRWRLYFA